MERAGVVQGLVGHPATQGPIADHGDAAGRLVAQAVAHGQAQRQGGRHAGVGAGERVVRTLRGAGIAAQAALGPQGVKLLGPAGEQFVRIDLVADVPDEAVARGVEDVVQSDGQLHHPQGPAQMATVERHGLDNARANLVRQFLQLRQGETPQVRGGPQCGQKGAHHGILLLRDSTARWQTTSGAGPDSRRRMDVISIWLPFHMGPNPTPVGIIEVFLCRAGGEIEPGAQTERTAAVGPLGVLGTTSPR